MDKETDANNENRRFNSDESKLQPWHPWKNTNSTKAGRQQCAATGYAFFQFHTQMPFHQKAKGNDMPDTVECISGEFLIGLVKRL